MKYYINAVLFDVGGVLIEYSEYKHADYIAQLIRRHRSISSKDVYNTIEKYLGEFERGLTKTDVFVRNVSGALGITVKEFNWCRYFMKHSSPNPNVIELAGGLKERGFVIGFLSNIDRCRYAYLRNLLDFSMFDYRLASCYLGYRKPDKRIYMRAAQIMHINVNNILFIDNMKKNVDGARAAGLQSILFKSAKDLKLKLAKMGL